MYLFRTCIVLLGITPLSGLALAQGAPPQGARSTPAIPPKPAVPNAKPVRTCESLSALSLPNTTVESAAVDANNPNICRVTAITTHPPMGDKVKIWVAIPMTNWNGRFLGAGGGGLSGGSAGGVNQPLVLGYAAGATVDAPLFLLQESIAHLL